ncbi:WbqC family protein [Pectobacterium carotovorum]|uniref:WbqC family protein n=1 Tax=Pectobacterium carotovorum TaxID=554 RepID=UPI002B0598EE|nr:WbqC family protein [Pectobacterium carotovorum]
MKKSVAIMQPYIFPYVGYFSLIESVDVFIFYDDVNYIKNGWINKNRILLNGKPHKFTVPVSNASQNLLICDISIHDFDEFRKKFKNKIYHAYKNSPYYDNGSKYIDAVFENVKERSIANLAISSILTLYKILNKKENKFFRSSELDKKFIESKREERLINISKSFDASRYINAIGGAEIYSKEYFSQHGIDLYFLKPELVSYKQINDGFVSGLSIIDVIMFNSLDAINDIINVYEVI